MQQSFFEKSGVSYRPRFFIHPTIDSDSKSIYKSSTLLAGTSIGLAAGVTGGSAAISEKIVKSRQMKAAKTALEADEKATHDVQEKLQDLAQNKNFVKKITADFIKTGGSITSSSIKLSNLLMSSGSGLLTKGLETTAQLFGDDIGREVSKLIVAGNI